MNLKHPFTSTRNPSTVVWWIRTKEQWPILIWLVALVAFVVMSLSSEPAGAIRGVVDVVHETVAPLETGRIRAMYLHVGDPVKAGDIVASLDTSLIDSELLFKRTQLVMEGLQIQRQFASSVVNAERDLQLAMFTRDATKIELAAVEREIQQLETRLDKRLIHEETVSPWRVRRLTLQQELAHYPKRIQLLEHQLESARTLTEQMQSYVNVPDNIETNFRSDDLEAKPTLIRHGINSLKMRRNNHFIRAQHDGVISSIEKEPGEVVQAGEPILSLVVDCMQQIVAFVPEAQAHNMHIGSEVVCSRMGQKRTKVKGTLLAMAPEIQPLPANIGSVSGAMIRGRRIMLQPHQHNIFLPGESVSIREHRTVWWQHDREPMQREPVEEAVIQLTSEYQGLRD